MGVAITDSQEVIVMEKKGDELTFRPMEPEDVNAILSIDRKISGMQRAITYEVNQIIGGNLALSFVAETEAQVIGFVLATLTCIPEEVIEACAILTVGIDPDYQHQGVATRLIQALLDACRSKGIRTVRTMVDEHDSQLKSLFEKMDFQRGRLVQYLKDV